jgi:hypothetical protein
MIRVRSHNNNTSSAPQTRRLMRREAGQLWRKKTLKLPRKEGTHRKIFLPKRYRVERSLPARPPGERSASVTGRVRPDSVTRREGKLCTPSKSAGGTGQHKEPPALPLHGCCEFHVSGSPRRRCQRRERRVSRAWSGCPDAVH